MGISLNQDTQRLIEERMKQGGYTSADEMLQDMLEATRGAAIGPLDEETLDAIDRAEAQIKRGEYRDVEDVRREWHEKRAAR